MDPPNFLKSNGPVRCPSCGSERLHLRSSPDRIDRLYQTPVRTVQRLFGAQLYHCFVCRIQFYDLGAAAPQEMQPDAEPAPAPMLTEPVLRDDTIIGPAVTIKGRVTCSENVSLDGTIDGPVAIPAHRLTIGPAGRIRGGVEAGEVVAFGTVHGNVQARGLVALGSSAKVTGNIRSASLSIADGAYFQGKVETLEKP